MTHRSRTIFRLATALLMTVAATGCVDGAPGRISNIQNPNAISDDISAVWMTESDSLKVPDPNLSTTYPHSYQLPPD
jgi:hypothetical protein